MLRDLDCEEDGNGEDEEVEETQATEESDTPESESESSSSSTEEEPVKKVCYPGLYMSCGFLISSRYHPFF